MFAILFEVLLREIQEEIHHFAGWEGGLMRTKIVNRNFVNKLAFPTLFRIPNTPETENPGIHIERCPKRILRGAVVDVQEGAR